jgi:lysophospholipase L1-like esterase
MENTTMLEIFFENIRGLGFFNWLIIGTVYIVVLSTLRMLWFLTIHRNASQSSSKYSQAFKGGKRILILGDSTAVGVGATKAEFSIAGRLGKFLPTCEIRNLGQNGARTMDVLEQLEQVKNETFDLTIISVGGNDAWHFTSLRSLKYSLMLIVDEANRISNNRVLFLIYSNIGSAPLFPAPLRVMLGKRSKKIRDLFLHITTERGAYAIDLSTNNDSLKKDTQSTYYAEDRIHPSDNAYAIWYKDIWRYIARKNFAGATDQPELPVHDTL